MPTIVHFGVPCDNFERSMKFYKELFGWKIEKGSGSFEYWQISTADDKGNEGIPGIMFSKARVHGITNFIGVDSVDDYSSKVQQLGGKIVFPKSAVPGGSYAICVDTENNTFAIWEDAAK